MMLYKAIGYTSRSPIVRIDGILNSVRYTFGVLPPVTLPYIRVFRSPTVKHDNVRTHDCADSLIGKMFDCFPGLHFPQIFHQ
ncbi:hypothetical protein TNCV_2440521 [Trichonephila clavipes]|nr:hypothetical protein TNCV_2440521 [Trichonephila clavipes]